eukprot:scaffold957_cov402-Prasinococcus_capsulatus_cf.AAC.25
MKEGGRCAHSRRGGPPGSHFRSTLLRFAADGTLMLGSGGARVEGWGAHLRPQTGRVGGRPSAGPRGAQLRRSASPASSSSSWPRISTASFPRAAGSKQCGAVGCRARRRRALTPPLAPSRAAGRLSAREPAVEGEESLRGRRPAAHFRSSGRCCQKTSHSCWPHRGAG